MRRWLFASLTVALMVAQLASTPIAEADAPELGTVSTGRIRSTRAWLEGTVDPKGLPTTYYFEYGLQADFSDAVASTSTEIPESAAKAVSAEVSGLSPNTTYYFRLIASNSSGTVTGTAEAGTAGSFTTISPGFGFLAGTEGFSGSAVNAVGGAAAIKAAIRNHTLVSTVPAIEAGSHPFEVSFDLGLNDVAPEALSLEAPVGLVVNPQASVCALADFNAHRISPFEVDPPSQSGENCPAAAQLGTLRVETSHGTRTFGLFNMTPAVGSVASFAASPFGHGVFFDLKLEARPDGSYSFVLDSRPIPPDLALFGAKVSLWGTPREAIWDRERGICLNEANPSKWKGECSLGSESVIRSQLSLPPQCAGPLKFGAVARAAESGQSVSVSVLNNGPDGQPVDLHCDHFQFSPALTAHFDNTHVSSPSGFVFRLLSDQLGLTVPFLLNPSPPRKVVVSLPAGATLNPSVAAELGACSPAQFAAEPSVSASQPGCPRGSKIGTLTVETPLFDTPISGAVYLATPDDPATSLPGAENPFDELVAIYVVAKAPSRGLVVKLAGQIKLDPATGTVTTIIDGLPELPYENLEVKFRAGTRSLLNTPSSCGYVPTHMEVFPWSGLLPVDEDSYTLIKTGIDGGPCPTGTPSFAPKVMAGAINSNVNSFTPYLVHISRQDNEQEITSYSLVLPKGVTGKLAGVATCSDAAIEAARSRRGRDEAAVPSCPESSRVGRTFTGYGLGSALTYTEGKVYLAGPYHGAPLSLVTINPASLGPFDLGTIVYRAAFQVDSSTAQLRLDSNASDPFPHIRDGVILHLRDIHLAIDRPEFTHNPSSCEPSRLTSTLSGSGLAFEDPSDDATAQPSSFFQLLNCRLLGFQPSLGVRLRGKTRRGGFPELRATFAARGPTDSNLKQIAVVIPGQEFLAQEHIRSICSRAHFAAGTCPADSVYGSAAAFTPLLDQPLRGNVYLVSSNGALPDLVADLHSGAVRIILRGRIGPGNKGGIQAFFADLPDQPLDKFVMRLYGGKRGLLVNSANTCSKPPIASVKAIAQNNVGAVFTSILRGKCKGSDVAANPGGSNSPHSPRADQSGKRPARR